jgi:glycosyltransferase involved in cell wall biosynthesis
MTIIFDKLIYFGGAERVLFHINEALNPKDIVVLFDNKNNAWKNILINTRQPKWGCIFSKRSIFILFYPIICALSTTFKVDDDVIFCYSSSNGKFFKLRGRKKFLYVNFPARGIVNPEVFFNNKLLLFLIRPLTKIYIYFERHQYKKFDDIYCISKYTQGILKKTYNVDSKVLYCPTSEIFYLNQSDSPKRESYYILISRLEKMKQLEYVFEAFTILKLNLVVVGTGSLLDSYIKHFPTINFKGYESDENLINLLSRAKACIVPTILEYGLPIIESFARGTPIIAVRSPASEELIIDNEKKYNSKFGYSYDSSTSLDLMNAVKKNEKENYLFDHKLIKKMSLDYHPNIFKNRLKEIVNISSK